nr:retrovirus-related Pol polyprotein from transposon TNT 1-94 [Tanacetum cinerariifolium]
AGTTITGLRAGPEEPEQAPLSPDYVPGPEELEQKTQVNLQLQVQHVRTDNERRNRTLVEAARTMLTFANLPLFLWAEAIATACFSQNRSIIHKRFDKTPYELMNKRKPNIKFFRVFRCGCYLLNDYKDVGKLKAK